MNGSSSTSSLSSTMIGAHEEIYQPAKEIYREEALAITSYISGIHHCRKQAHNQVMYPNTINTLSNYQTEKSFNEPFNKNLTMNYSNSSFSSSFIPSSSSSSSLSTYSSSYSNNNNRYNNSRNNNRIDSNRNGSDDDNNNNERNDNYHDRNDNYLSFSSSTASLLDENSTKSFLYNKSLTSSLSRSCSNINIKNENIKKNYDNKIKTLKQFENNINNYTKSEKFINSRKRNYFHEKGREAVVPKILSGKAPIAKYNMFPLKATHQQILAMTGGLKGSDPYYIPPPVERKTKWKGDMIGWKTEDDK